MINKVILVGNLGTDPDYKLISETSAVCRLNLATSETYLDKNSQKQQKTEWHRVVVWNKKAEICAKYLKKGSKVYIEGKLETRSYEKDGSKLYTTEVVALNFQFLDGKKQESNEHQVNSNSHLQNLDNHAPQFFDEHPEMPF